MAVRVVSLRSRVSPFKVGHREAGNGISQIFDDTLYYI